MLSAVIAVAAMPSACGEDPSTPSDVPVPTSVTVSPSSTDLGALEETVQLTATVQDQNGEAMSGVAVTWMSSAAAVATVTAAGLVRAAGNGRTTIKATVGDVSGRAGITVTQVPAVVQLDPDLLFFEALGAAATVEAAVLDANGHAIEGVRVHWTSGDTAVAQVGPTGLVTATGNGRATIAATAEPAAGIVAVRVMQVADSVALFPSTGRLAPGDTLRLLARAFDANGHLVAGIPHVWVSSDPSVAEVDDAGLVQAIAEGRTTITAASPNAQGSAELRIEKKGITERRSGCAGGVVPSHQRQRGRPRNAERPNRATAIGR